MEFGWRPQVDVGKGGREFSAPIRVSLKITLVWSCVLRSCCSVGSLWHAQKYAKKRVQSSMVTFNSLQSVFFWSPLWRGGSWLPSENTLSLIYSGNFSIPGYVVSGISRHMMGNFFSSLNPCSLGKCTASGKRKWSSHGRLAYCKSDNFMFLKRLLNPVLGLWGRGFPEAVHLQHEQLVQCRRKISVDWKKKDVETSCF